MKGYSTSLITEMKIRKTVKNHLLLVRMYGIEETKNRHTIIKRWRKENPYTVSRNMNYYRQYG